jgi:hypothetical protein
MKVLKYLKARLDEKGTWLAIGAGVTGAAALEPPWSYIFVTVAVLGALIPTK